MYERKTVKTQKGFTIVELVICIAVIAILSAILIPTFANVINDAKETADIQTAINMNTTILTGDFEAQDMVDNKPQTSGWLYVYIIATETIVIIDEDKKIVWSGDDVNKVGDELTDDDTYYDSSEIVEGLEEETTV